MFASLGVKAIAALIGLTAILGFGWYVKSIISDNALLAANNAALEKNMSNSIEASKRAEELEALLQKLRSNQRKRDKELRNVIKNSNLDKCIIPDDGLRIYNAARLEND